MRSYSDLTKMILLTLLLGLGGSCAKIEVAKPPRGSFYVTPEITYLLDSPGYSGHVLSPLYRGDKVEWLDGGESPWWQVELKRGGQVGWIPKELLSPDPVSAVFYYVNEDTIPLLECPRTDCIPIQLLFRGDQVQRVGEEAQGWWRVLTINSRSLGWVPASALTQRIEAAQRKQIRKPYYYVAVKKLILRAKPSNQAEVIRTLSFNDQVEKIGEIKGWFNVRQPSSGAVGWVIGRDLETLPLVSPRGVPAKNELKPFKQKEEPQIEPEFL
jgi:uncharacterized protein YgiM (DUF1202 family)